MKLTNYEQDVLNGKYGEGAAMAMEIQVAIGETFDAPRMVPVTRTHVALSAQDADCGLPKSCSQKGQSARFHRQSIRASASNI